MNNLYNKYIMNHDYIFIIYSCKKNIEIANAIYDKVNNNIPKTKPYIIYGNDFDDPCEKYKLLDNKYIVLNVKDDYDSLCHKTLLLIRSLNHLFPNIKGIFKCDDDMFVNVDYINWFLEEIDNNSDIHYCGMDVTNTKETVMLSKKKYPIYQCNYAGGPLYYLSKHSMTLFDEPTEVFIIYYEDMMVGYHLNKFNIYVTNNYKLYSDDINESLSLSYHNKNKHQHLYIVIHGGLGNQLFQMAAAIQFAQIYNKQFSINTTFILPNPHQNNNTNITLGTLKKLFPGINICNTHISGSEYYVYNENKYKCFTYNYDEIINCLDTYTNVILYGYFINYKYIPMDVFSDIVINPVQPYLSTFDFTNVYFIHIRLGDYLKNKMYLIKLDNYYNDCIDKILESNPDAKFIICTNQYDSTLYKYLNNFKKGIRFILQNANATDIDTLYIMASCCGGICSNSTLSFMGSILQKTKTHIYMPYPFLDFVDGYNINNVTLDMYPHWSNVYNSITSTFFN